MQCFTDEGNKLLMRSLNHPLTSTDIAIYDSSLRSDQDGVREIHKSVAALLYSRAQFFDALVRLMRFENTRDIEIVRREMSTQIEHEENILLYLEGKED